MSVEPIGRPVLAPIERMASPRAIAPEREDAFRALMATRLDGAYRLAAMVLGDESEAEDATHDAVVRAWAAFGSLRDPASFPAWFQRIVVNVCPDRMRRMRVRRSISLVADIPGLPSVADAADGAPERDALARALEQLTPDHRMVVVLRF